MWFHVRSLGIVILVALASGLLWQTRSSSAAPALAPDNQQATLTVTIFDNNAPGTTFHPDQDWWGFGPNRIAAAGGERIVFTNASSGGHGHTVTSLERVGSPFDNRVNVGTRFDSSPTADRVLQPGQTFTVDTSLLPAGNYAYFCKLHPWMVGEITVIR